LANAWEACSSYQLSAEKPFGLLPSSLPSVSLSALLLAYGSFFFFFIDLFLIHFAFVEWGKTTYDLCQAE
jgi:hypothetical protein